jgi:hypothetical protein
MRPLIPIGCGRCRWEQGRELLLGRRLARAVGGEGEESWRDSRWGFFPHTMEPVEEVVLDAELGGVRGTERLVAARFQASPCLRGVDRTTILADQASIRRKN